MTTDETFDFNEWRPVGWAWTSPTGCFFMIAVTWESIDGAMVESFALSGNGIQLGKFTSIEKAEDKVAEILKGIPTWPQQ